MTYIPFFKRAFAFLCIVTLLVITTATALTPEEELGKELFYDTALSNPAGQSCSACHSPEVGFTGPDSDINAGGAVYEGAVAGRFGNRKPPAAAYAGDSPILHFNVDGTWTGGMFWDGRATGETLGDPLAEQALGPFLNPLEQNLPAPATVVNIVKGSSYAPLFEQVWGAGSLEDPVQAYERIGRSIASYERSEEVNPFSSRYDAFLKGAPTLTDEELKGLELFEGKAQCSACHPPPLFTDYTYDNLGVPRNEDNPFYDELAWNPLGDAWVDSGIGGFLEASGYPPAASDPEMGKMKVPTLRNVDKRPYEGFVKAYAHNGFFKSLEEIVHFYNTRDVLAQCSEPLAIGEEIGVNCWPAPETAANINTGELGDLGMTADEEAEVVAFLKTLTDECTNTVNVVKFYDANANGIKDTGEQELNGWKYRIDGSDYFTPVDAVVPAGTYTVIESIPLKTSWQSTTATSVEVAFDGCSQTSDVLFGNLCLGPGGGLTHGFWSNKNGQDLIGSDDLAMLSALNLWQVGGKKAGNVPVAEFNPTTKAQVKTFLSTGNAVDMRVMLSVQLAAMELNVFNGKVSGGALVDGGSLGTINVNKLMNDANNALMIGSTATRAELEALKNALDYANNNKNFVQSVPCAFSFA